MSSTINMDMVLISSSNIIPQNKLKEVFSDCINELGGQIINNNLYLNNDNLGRLTINNRIVLSFSSDYETRKRKEIRNLIRDTFTRKVSIVHQNYISELKKNKEKLEQEAIAEEKLFHSINLLQEEINKSEIGFKRQNQSECEAMKAEIVDAAIAQGYEVIEEKTNEGIQLQFIRRDY